MAYGRSLLLAILAVGSINSVAYSTGYWPTWRGSNQTGVSATGNPPLSWSESENRAWKTLIPGEGSSSPIVWKDRVFVTTAIGSAQASGEGWRRVISPTGPQSFCLIALDRATGKVVWQTTVSEETPHEGTHRDGTWASNSPVTDGEHVYAFFGSRGIFCVDLEGKVVWSKDLGDQQTRFSFGEGSSPALHGDTLIMNWDHEGESFVVALDKRSGKELWRKDRDERTSWSTPLVLEIEGRTQAIIAATNQTRSYDLKNGEIIWQVGGMTSNVIPSPVFADGFVYLASGFQGAAMLVVDAAKARGDVSGTDAVAWTYAQDTPYVPSTLVYEGRIYFLKGNRGILSCLDAKTGKVKYIRQRLEGVSGIYASPVGASGRVYLTGRDGTTIVIASGDEYEVLSVNRIDEHVDASIAVAGRDMFVRGYQSLYCFREGSAE